jgi:hypothetical protein
MRMARADQLVLQLKSRYEWQCQQVDYAQACSAHVENTTTSESRGHFQRNLVHMDDKKAKPDYQSILSGHAAGQGDSERGGHMYNGSV